ncbi:MAG: hypothetical protein LBL07_09470 [Tannerella sp.]|nr:hypothetical protein [Tannerella sp.]
MIKIENKRTGFLYMGIILAGIIILGFFVQSCSDDSFSSETDADRQLSEMELKLIAESNEFEDYMMTAADLLQSFRIFEKELAKVDYAKLETVIENGREVRYLPEAIRTLQVDRKVVLMNEKKEILLNKYPQLSEQELLSFTKCVDICIGRSIRVNEFFLDKKINIYRPLLKSVIAEYEFDTINQLVGYLYGWTFSPDYVEVHAFFFTDGTYMVALDSRNTANGCAITITTAGDKHYFNGKEISVMSHTQTANNTPSDRDFETKEQFPHCSHAIFYNAGFYFY